MPWYMVTVEEFHVVEIETEADNEDAAMDKVEGNDWDENTYIVNDETQDRSVINVDRIEDEQPEKED